MLTKPAAGAMARVAKSPGTTRRWPSSSRPVWLRAKGVPEAGSGMSGSVSSKPKGRTTSRRAQSA